MVLAVTGDFAALRADLVSRREIVVAVKVIPRSSRTVLAGRMDDGALKIRVAAPPENGRANQALLNYLCAELELPRAAAGIVSGATAQRKLVRLRLPE